MGLPKKSVKPSIPLNYPKTLLPRREEIKDMITKDGTYLPKSLLHADLDGGFLDFVKQKFNITTGSGSSLLVFFYVQEKRSAKN
jgi:hypothetical protein